MDTHSTEQLPTQAPEQTTWQSMYRSERKKARILGASTVAASLLAVSAGAWGLSNAGSATSPTPGQFGGPGTSQMGPQAGQGMMPGQGSAAEDLASALFNDDGSVNTSALEQFVATSPGGDITQFLTFAVTNGELTQEQADALIAAASGDTGSQDT
ncbi:MAG: hypothetical protein MUF33_02030 [Candidatus Nanopelagicales bacterium]|nr:hypothetical protein [Candidatus Nanopelagicales bacterium]